MRKTGKFLITTIVLTVLFAVFAFTSSAAGSGTSADPYTGEITTDMTWEDGTYVQGLSISGGSSSDYLVIEVSGTVTVNDTINILGGSSSAYKHVLIKGVGEGATLKAKSGFGSSSRTGVITIPNWAKVELQNITIDVNSYTFNEQTKTGSVTNANDNAAVNLTGGSAAFVTIGEGTVITGASGKMGAVGPYGVITLAGGTITKNAYSGVYIYSNASTKLTIDSGEISWNGFAGGTDFYGGGVRIRRGTLTINGGRICNNYAGKYGGGISADTANTASHKINIVMNGGTISDNYSVNYGGGIYTYKAANATSVTFTMNGGAIENNSSNANGGGLYIGSNCTATINNGTFTGNSTATNGGALISGGTITIKGGTFTGNSAAGTNAGVHISGGTANIYYGVNIDNNMNTSTSAEGTNLIIGGNAVINFYYEWNAERQAKESLANFADFVIGDRGVDAPATAGTRTGSATIIIDGEVKTGTISIPENANVILQGKTGSTPILTYAGGSENNLINVSGTLTVKNITLKAGNSTATNGISVLAVASGATLNIQEGAVITGGNSISGAGIYNQGTVNMTGGSIIGNHSFGGGGGVNNNSTTASFTMTGGTITENTAGEEGGAGIYTFGGATLTIGGNAVISGNTFGDTKSNVFVGNNGATKENAITVNADFEGEAGFHAIFSGAETTKTFGTLAEGYSGTITNDEEGFVTMDISSGSFVFSAVAANITVASPNGGNVVISNFKRNRYVLPTPTAPTGYTNDDFIGYVLVSGYGTNPKALALYQAGDAVSAEDVANLYATWVKVNTLVGASAKLDGASGLRFITTVESGILNKVGISVKSGTDAGEGYLRGMVLGTSALDMSTDLSKTNCKIDKNVENNGWLTASTYKKYTGGATLANGTDAFAFSLTYGNASNYNKAVAFRGYIEITVGDSEKVVYSAFNNPGTLTDGDQVTYGDVHARSARAVIRKLYFGNTTPDGTENSEAIAMEKLGSYYNKALEIGGYDSFPSFEATGEQIAYYLNPLAKGADVTADSEITHVVMFGNSVVAGHNMADLVEEFGTLSGNKVNVSSMTYNNLGTSSSQSLRALFKRNAAGTSFVDANGNDTTDVTKFVVNTAVADGVGSKLKHILSPEGIDNTPVDKLYIVIDREIPYTRDDLTDPKLETLAAAALVYKMTERYPGIEITIVQPPVYELDDFRCTDTTGLRWYKTKSEMQTGLDTATTKFKAAIATICPNLSVATFSLDDYYLGFGLSDIDLLAKEISVNSSVKFNGQTIHRHPTIAGAYLSACLFYYDITGICPLGIEAYGVLPESEAQAIQNEAHRLIGCTKTTHSHTSLDYGVISGSGVYAVANDNVTPTAQKWTAMLATIMAYDARGSWFHYDQKTLNRNVNTVKSSYRDYRHSGTDDEFSYSGPEDANPYNTVYGDCSDWITQIFYETFGNEAFTKFRGCSTMYREVDAGGSITNISNVYTWTDDNSFDNLFNETVDNDGVYALYLNGTKSSDNYSKVDAKTKFLETLKPGDVILYIHYTEPNANRSNGFSELGGHVMIYLGNGILAHCSGDQAGGGGSDYHVNSKSDLYENSGGIQIDPIDVFIDDNAVRNIFDEAAVLLLRPNYDNMTVTENAQNRVDNMLGIVAYNHATTSDGSVVTGGITVAANSEITFNFVIENRTPYLRKLTVEDTIAAGLTYLSGGSLSGNKVTIDVTLDAYETKTVSYTVRVNSNASGAITMDSAYIGGVHMGDASLYVDNVLTAEEQTEFAQLVRANAGTVSSMYDLAKIAYSGIGKTLTSDWSSASTALGRLYSTTTVSGVEYYQCTSASAIRAGNLYGGLNLYANYDTNASGGYNDPLNRRAKHLEVEDFIAGDIILFVAQNTARYKDSTLADTTIANNADAYVYLGNGTFALYLDGVYTEVSGSAATMLLDSILGEKLYCVIRPSHSH